MADAAVEFLLENLTQLAAHHIQLISGVGNEIENLKKDLSLFQAFLKDSSKKRRKDERMRNIIGQIRDVVYEAEDIIDTFVTQTARIKSSNYFLKFFKKPVTLAGIAEKVQSVGTAVKRIYGEKGMIDFATRDVEVEEHGNKSEQVSLIKQQENVVGFEDEVEKIKGYLTQETQQLDVISIIGMPGLGKTTLAGMIYRDPRIQYKFPTRIWVNISQEFTSKDVFLAILKVFEDLTEHTNSKNDVELAEVVADHLESGNFLIVMDDVWTTDDWDKLQIALPKSNKMCKVLITSRHEEVAQYANPDRLPHKLRFLTPDESWELFQLKVFGKPECPPKLKIHGKLIVEQCDRLPLAIVVIGGILAKKFIPSHDINARAKAWAKVSQSVGKYLQENSDGRMEKIISLSYDKLPYHLRPCFLYFGMFPEDFEIPVWKLIRMWIAEGFIQQKETSSLEETSEGYLEDLISRNLVIIDKIKPNGKLKTCRIHDMLRDFCKKEARYENENFFEELKESNDGVFEHAADLQKYRRLSIHSNFSHFISSQPYGPGIRTFVCYSKEEIKLKPENSSAIPKAFKLLRVLDAKPIELPKIPSDMYDLVHLRFIALSFRLATLPPAFAKLWNIQTLIVDTTSPTLEIKADLWKMNQLRHFKTNASATLPRISENSKEGEKLQTLGTISVESCTAAVFQRAHNLKKLGIRGRLALLFDDKNGSFDSLGKLNNLEKMKLQNDVFASPSSESQMRGLPQHQKFPRNLRSLTLSATSLDREDMSILGLLKNLEVLKLKDIAFMGKSWVVTDDRGFPLLEFLLIEKADLVVWEAQCCHFPSLRHLVLRNCEKLQEVPNGLADIATFQQLDLHRTKLAVASAKRIQTAKQYNQTEPATKASTFKLSIVPLDD